MRVSSVCNKDTRQSRIHGAKQGDRGFEGRLRPLAENCGYEARVGSGL